MKFNLYFFLLCLVTTSAFFSKLGGLPPTKMSANANAYPIYCDENVMSQKGHGTCDKPVQKDLRWGCDQATADRICCFNRHYAEHSGYWLETKFLDEVRRMCYAAIIFNILWFIFP